MYPLYYSPGSCSLIINCPMEEPARPAVARALQRGGIKPFGA